MKLFEFDGGNFRSLDSVPAKVPDNGFVWAYLERDQFGAELDALQRVAEQLGGSPLLDVHVQDLVNAAHPSDYDATSVYDRVIFRRLATEQERRALASPGSVNAASALVRIDSRAIGFVVFDRLIVSVHNAGCDAARVVLERIAAHARLGDPNTVLRPAVPQTPAELALRMINLEVDGYLALRKDLTDALETAQNRLLRPRPLAGAWAGLMNTRQQLRLLQGLCDEQQDAIQEWLDDLREQPLSSYAGEARLAQHARDQLIARARDVMEHIDRVLRQAHQLEQTCETLVQMHFSAQNQRTNDIMLALTAITAVFLPLNLFTGFFGMNFEHLPLIHGSAATMWSTLAAVVVLVAVMLAWLWRLHYLAPRTPGD